MISEKELYPLLRELEISYEKIEHPPLFTCEDAFKLGPKLDGADTKNLFLRNNKGNKHYLLSIPHEKTVDLKALGDVLGSGRLGFASPERLQRFLGVTPGSVTMLSLINDTELAVEFIMDSALRDADTICCHPLINTATLSIPKADMLKFIAHTKHEITFIDTPTQ